MSTPSHPADASDVPAPHAVSQPCAEGTGGGDGSLAPRVDHAHGKVPGRAADKRAARDGVGAAASATKPNRPEHVATDSDHWLQLHATDLIDRLQQTAETLDAREARLHAQIALHERREREFRLWSDSQRQELAELRHEAAQLRDRLQAEARRLVMSERGH